MTIDEALQVGIAHHRAGRLGEAEQVYRQILGQAPNSAETLHLLGVLAGQVGRADVAEKLVRQAIAIKPQEVVFYSNLSKMLGSQGRHAEAMELQSHALRLHPLDGELHFEMGALHQARGDEDAAMASYREALRLNPQLASALNNLGLLYKGKGQLEEAENCFRRGLEVRPEFVEAHANLGRIHDAKGKFLEAAGCYQAALQINPKYVEIWFNLGFSLNKLLRVEEAVAAYRHLLALKPDHIGALNNLGSALRSLGRLDEAGAAFREALKYKPDFVEAISNLGTVLDRTGEVAEAIACFRRALELKPEYAGAHSNLVYVLHFDPASTRSSLLAEHVEWNRRHARPLRKLIQPHANVAEPERRLRIGYFSPDFHNHAVGRFMLPLLEQHDREAFEVYCYADGPFVDSLTERLRSNAEHWRPTAGLADHAVAELVRRDGIDILVDLTMHMAGSRLLMFAEKPAPVQVTYLAFCSTTGVETIDYRITDPYMDPPEWDLTCYTEQSVHVETYWCYAASQEAPAVNELPALQVGHITFGCLNSFNKVSDGALAVWGRLMLAVPGSRLILHAHAGNHRERIWKKLAEMGVERGRCEFLDRVSVADYFRVYHRIDMCLDPFPYAGGTTTCDSLFMGVPVVTLGGGEGTGQTAVGRGGVSILSIIGRKEWIAESLEQYAEIVLGLAGDWEELRKQRATLRERMEASVLMDAPRFARTMEAAYRQMWRKWCAGKQLASDPTYIS